MAKKSSFQLYLSKIILLVEYIFSNHTSSSLTEISGIFWHSLRITKNKKYKYIGILFELIIFFYLSILWFSILLQIIEIFLLWNLNLLSMFYLDVTYSVLLRIFELSLCLWSILTWIMCGCCTLRWTSSGSFGCIWRRFLGEGTLTLSRILNRIFNSKILQMPFFLKLSHLFLTLSH